MRQHGTVSRNAGTLSDGRHVLRFAPQAFVARLCALVPPRRFHRVRYAGIFSGHSRGRFAITGRGLHDSKDAAAPRATTSIAPKPSRTVPERIADGPDDPTRQRRLDWACLLKRSFGVDALQCPTCHGRMELIATIEDRDLAMKILSHLGLPTRAPPRPPPWRPPQTTLPAFDESVDPPVDAAVDAPSAFQ